VAKRAILLANNHAGGDQTQLFSSIRKKLYILPADLMVVPGHGPLTTIGQEQKTNPFVQHTTKSAKL